MSISSLPCFNCLQRHIESDLSSDIIFRYGISDSPLPFGSTAVIQICLNGGADNAGSEEVSAQFLLAQLENDDDNSRLYSKIAAVLTPAAHDMRDSDLSIKDLIRGSETAEEKVISSLNIFLKEKTADVYSSSFLSLVGFPSFDETCIRSCVRHPNISPVVGIIKSPNYNYLLGHKAPYNLENILKYSPEALKSDWHIRFLIYQILSALVYMHGLGISHGNIRPSSILLNESCWSWLNIFDLIEQTVSSSSNVFSCLVNCPVNSISSKLTVSTSADWYSNFLRWWKGELSNYEYLLILNKLAGRTYGDHTFHTVMPWVIDFTVKPNENSDTGWRDLTKSKWRLAKGDEQLDFTFQTSEIPHHISDECLSELAVCSYKARRLPLNILRHAVRSVYEPNEYPSNMQRLYQWTPDECIPEFYSDPQIFCSLHSEMCDLAIPSWASSPEEFISLHRNALESDRVSKQLHHWIDITFGYKLSGEASITAKNVMLPISDLSMPRSAGRFQLFTTPHPMRQLQGNKRAVDDDNLLPATQYLADLEQAISFREYAHHLCPVYKCDSFNAKHQKVATQQPINCKCTDASVPNLSLLEYFDTNDGGCTGFHELLYWNTKLSFYDVDSEDLAEDVFSLGCILAEVYLKRPLFNSLSLAAYKDNDVMPDIIQDLPPHVAVLVNSCIHKDWKRRPSAKCLLESQYFPPTVRAAYLFLAPLQLLAEAGPRLQYASKVASEGALRAMGAYAAEMCAPYCIPLIMSPLSNEEAESALSLLKEFLKCLNCRAIKTLILPSLQKILQVSEYSHLKVSLLQDSFIQDLWKRVGKNVYLEKIHPLVIANLYDSPNKISASVASVALIGSSEELGIPITIHQTILPIIHSFGKGLGPDGIDVLIRIGGLHGENFIVKQLLPLVTNVILSCIEASNKNMTEPQQSWISLALTDSFSALDGLVSVLSAETVIKELFQDQICIHTKVLMQQNLGLPVLQTAAATLLGLCQRIGSDLTISHIMPQLKELFEELAFCQEAAYGPGSSKRYVKISRLQSDEDAKIESRLDLLLMLYPSFASIVGMEKLRQSCSTWFLLEQILQRFYSWKWDSTGDPLRLDSGQMKARNVFDKISSSHYNPSKNIATGKGWSPPQSQGSRSVANVNLRQDYEVQQRSSYKHQTQASDERLEPWFWFPSSDVNCVGPDFLGRGGGLKDEIPWKVKASILYSARAHPGVLKSLAVDNNECTIFTAGVGPGFKGSVQKWELPRMQCVSGYYGHDEVVNSICILTMTGRVASCDGSIHVWNGQTGKLIAAYSESSSNLLQHGIPLATKFATDQSSMLSSNVLSGGVLSNALSGSLYTCMHHLEYEGRIVAGMGNGSVRFIDVIQDKKLHLWKSDASENSFSSIVSTICCCGSKNTREPSWIAAGLSSGYCRLLDARSGNIVAVWRAHEGHITKIGSHEDNLLLSSSVDKTLKVWDLRKSFGTQSIIFRGNHHDGISGFSVWGQDVISVSRNKIALTSLSRPISEGVQQQQLLPQKLYSGDKGTRNLSTLTTIDVLPYSRLFLVGTEDGYLKVCS